MSRHPSPFSYSLREDLEVDENIVGWFLVSFTNDVNHEYPFEVHKSGDILPVSFVTNETVGDQQIFIKYLTDPTLHSVTFIGVNEKEYRNAY